MGKTDLERGINFFKEASDNGNNFSSQSLGNIYENGIQFENFNLEKDLKLAYHYYNLGFEQGNALAAANIGRYIK
jgi:TPR repeat protein